MKQFTPNEIDILRTIVRHGILAAYGDFREEDVANVLSKLELKKYGQDERIAGAW